MFNISFKMVYRKRKKNKREGEKFLFYLLTEGNKKQKKKTKGSGYQQFCSSVL